MDGFALDLEAARRRALKRAFGVSAVAHGLLLLAFTLENGASQLEAATVITVDLIAMPAPAAPAPVSKPKVAPAPPPVEKVVLPKQARREPKPVVKPPPPPEPVVREEQDYDDVLAQLRSDAGEEAPEPKEVAAVAPPDARTTGAGTPVSAETLAWMRKAKLHVRRAWVMPAGFRSQALETRVSVQLDIGGNVIGEPDILRRSGNPWYDEGVVRAIQKASPLPAPPEEGVQEFVFVPEDSY